LFVQGSGETPRCLAGDGLQVVASLVRGERGGAELASLSRGSLVTAALLAAAVGGG
jgi:hypothetical protein